MLVLASTSDLVRAITSSTADLKCHASWVDLVDAATTATPGRTNTSITTATTTTLVASPASSTKRTVNLLSCKNDHATLTNDVTILHTDGTTVINLIKVTLAAGETLVHDHGTWFVYDVNGAVKAASPVSVGLPGNASIAAQSPTAATLTYLTGSAINIPFGKLRIGTILHWVFDVTKTAAGTAATAFHVRIGTAGGTGDTAILTFTLPVGTAVTDTGIVEIWATVRGPLTGSCILQGMLFMSHNLATTGLINVQEITILVTSSGFDATVANLIAGLTVTSGASVALTIQQVVAESLNL